MIRGIRFLLENSLFLIGGALLGLIWVNFFDSVSYHYLVHDLEFWVNDVAMCFFFALAAKEIREAILPGGDLSSIRKAAMPLLATIGGMAGPAAIYCFGCWCFQEPTLRRGWAITCATDIAFSYLFARQIFGPKHPAIPFLLLLAIADDAGGLGILAIGYPVKAGDPGLMIGCMGSAVGISLLMSHNPWKTIKSFWPYLLGPGVISWFGLHWGGLHPALALVPIIFTMPHARHDDGLFTQHRGHHHHDTLNNLQRWWKTPVELILGFFGLVNAGVVVGNLGLPTGLICGSLMLGKPLGIVLFVAIGHMFGLRLPTGVGAKELVVLGFTAGIGFTVALFVATIAFPTGATLDAAKMGALLSLGSGLVAWALAHLFRIKKMY